MEEVRMAVMTFGEKEGLRPAVRAAMLVALPVIALEMLTDLLPVIGLIIAIPVSILVYYFQGVMVARYAHSDYRYAGVSSSEVVSLSLRSALITGALISPIAAAVALMVGFPLSVGILLAWIPGILVSAVVDLGMNLAFTALGAWMSTQTSSGRVFGRSCLWILLGTSVGWLGISVLTVVAILYIVGVL